jgi:hypothetical protein
MSNIQSYNALIDRFKAFASGHFILKRFSHGQIEVSDLEKFGEYPFMHVIPSNVTYSQGMKTFSFQIVLADLPRDKEDKSEYQREALSDLQRIAEDLIAEITNHRVLFGDLITVQNVSLEPFLEEFQHTLTGWTVSLDLLVPYYWDACSIPAEWNDFFESSTGGTGSILTFIDSITRDENGNVSLVNDEAEPSPNYYYGTNDEGVRGWYLLTDEVGLTCATIGTCQTIIDIEAAIDLLQTDVTDLQGDVSSLETNKVPYTGATGNVDLGEYELKAGQIELDQTPTGTAGVGVMRWNDTDGTVDVGLKGGNVTLQVGQESVIRVVNKAGVNLLEANYQAVRVRLVSEGGAQGQRLAVVLALADTDADSATTIGLVTETINNNQEGFVTTSGEVKNINTTGSLQGETWVDGDILYLSGTTSGRITNVKPAAPTHTIIIGYVVYAHANNGKIFVKVDNGYELDELHNVSITSPTDNQALVYESASSLWKNETIDKTFVGLGNVDNTSDLNKPISTATQTALNAKQDTLGFTPVPETRTLTINGTTQDLSANRTFTIATGLTVGTTPITSGTVGRVLFEGTGNVLQQSGSLFWDNTNSRLGIGTATPSSALGIVYSNNTYAEGISINNTNTGTTALSGISFITATVTGGFMAYCPSNYTNVAQRSTMLFTSSGNNKLGFIANSNSSGVAQDLFFSTLGSNTTYQMQIKANGNVQIGTNTDAGFKLDVNGNSRITGTLNVTSVATLRGLVVSEAGNVHTLTAQGVSTSIRLISNSQSCTLFPTGNFAIGTTTDTASAILNVTSTTRGFLPPRMTNAQRLAIASPAVGLIVYCTDAVEGLYVNKSTGWTFVI